MSNFCITIPLKTETYQEHILEKRFEIGRKMYNSLIVITQKRYREMTKTKEYKYIMKQYKRIHEGHPKAGVTKKDLANRLKEMRREYRLSEYDFHKDVKELQHCFCENIDSNTSQKIATNLWKAYGKVMFSDGKEIHFKKYGEFTSLEGKSNTSGIRLVNETLYWNGLIIPVIINHSNSYENECFHNPLYKICYNRIIQKEIRGKYKYYLQVVFKGTPPVKYNPTTGEVKNPKRDGVVGIDLGTQTIAYCSNKEVGLIELADKVPNLEMKKRIIFRKMDRSRRAMNPNNYNEDGTIKTGARNWKNSNHYLRLRSELRELSRKQAAIRKLQHETLANHLLTLGTTIYVETMHYKGLQKRAKKTTVNEKTGKFNRKKRFGKSLGEKAPAMFVEILNRKLNYIDKEVLKVNNYTTKASQYNHVNQTYKKKKLSQRWNEIEYNNEVIKIQRDLYSSYLLMNMNEDLKTMNQEKCEMNFERFLIKHNQEVERLKGKKNLSSIGI